MPLPSTSTQQLESWARQFPTLAPHWVGALPADGLPAKPIKERPQAYIVNTDKSHEEGLHWIAHWTYGPVCEKMDSYGLPMEVYEATPIKRWMNEHWAIHQGNKQSLQAVNSETCGYYALQYLVDKSKGKSLHEFLRQFNKHDYVGNDAKVARWFQSLAIKRT